jgi:hypothetical protein
VDQRSGDLSPLTLDVALGAQGSALGDLGQSAFICPRPDLVIDLLRGIAVVELQTFARSTPFANFVPDESSATFGHPLLAVGTKVGHASWILPASIL